MAKKTPSFLDIQQRIAELTRQADELKAQEKSGVVERIKEAINVYGLSAADLFGKSTGKKPKAQAPAGAQKSGMKTTYGDGAGNTWAGRGPRPAWLRAALAAGRKLEEFAQPAHAAPASEAAPVAAKPAATASRKTGKASKAGKVAQKVAPKYKDEAGNTWSGRGLQPRWLKAALAQGKALQDFAV